MQRRTVAAGGTEKDGLAIYDAFHEVVKKSKQKAGDKSGQGSLSRAAGTGSSAAALLLKSKKAKFAASFNDDTVVTAAAVPPAKVGVSVSAGTEADADADADAEAGVGADVVVVSQVTAFAKTTAATTHVVPKQYMPDVPLHVFHGVTRNIAQKSREVCGDAVQQALASLHMGGGS